MVQIKVNLLVILLTKNIYFHTQVGSISYKNMRCLKIFKLKWKKLSDDWTKLNIISTWKYYNWVGSALLVLKSLNLIDLFKLENWSI